MSGDGLRLWWRPGIGPDGGSVELGRVDGRTGRSWVVGVATVDEARAFAASLTVMTGDSETWDQLASLLAVVSLGGRRR